MDVVLALWRGGLIAGSPNEKRDRASIRISLPPANESFPANHRTTELESASFLQRFFAQVIDLGLMLVVVDVPMALTNPRAMADSSLESLIAPALAYRLFGDAVFWEPPSVNDSSGSMLSKPPHGAVLPDAVRHSCGHFRDPVDLSHRAGRLAVDGQQRWGDRLARNYVLRRHPKPVMALR